MCAVKLAAHFKHLPPVLGAARQYRSYVSQSSIVHTHVNSTELCPSKLEQLLHLILIPHVTPPSHQLTTL